MRVRRCTTGTRRTPQFSTKVEIHGFADVTPNVLYVRHHLPQYFLNGMPIRCGIRFDQCTGFIDWLHSATGQQAQTPPRGLEPHPITCWPVAVVEYRSWPEAVDGNLVFVSRRRLSVSLADVRAAVPEAARQSVRDQLIQHAGKRLVLLEHKSEEAWGTPTKVTRRTSGRPHTCQGTLEK